MRYPNDFLSCLVIMDENCLHHYDRERKEQSMEWLHSSSSQPPPRPAPQKNSECKNPLKKFSPRFFAIKTALSSFIMV
jgi:hypothetical protein